MTEKEEQEFAQFAIGAYADWGYENLPKITSGELTEREYYYNLLLMLLAQFQRDIKKVWRFVEYALLPHQKKKCKQYLENSGRVLTENGIVKKEAN